MTLVTAVQLRERRPSAHLLYGRPMSVISGDFGHVARFAPDVLVAYQIESACRDSLFVFRTLVADDRLAAAITGVRPRVHLLLELHSAESLRRAGRVLADLQADGALLERLSDTFWGRVGTALRGRMAPHPTLDALVRAECPGAEP
jgi:hypothetical protein